MFSKVITPFFATIHMAGQVDMAKFLIQKWVMKGACVQVSECSYIYTGGREEGFTARFINYPVYPKSEELIKRDAVSLGEYLAKELGQISFTIETPKNITTYSFRSDKFETNKSE